MRGGEDNEAPKPEEKAGPDERREGNSLIVQHSALRKKEERKTHADQI
jgi:hypothetical protein